MRNRTTLFRRESVMEPGRRKREEMYECMRLCEKEMTHLRYPVRLANRFFGLGNTALPRKGDRRVAGRTAGRIRDERSHMFIASPAAVSRFRASHNMQPLCPNNAYNGDWVKKSRRHVLKGREDAQLAGDNLLGGIEFRDTVRLG